ncbi:hypothetical protein Taro_019925 [Colocasia esculenta]|uniref:Uncharacterized protein n=1 Tax=Colocasia esculenta TaxID=4460 RepID=A0A843UV10_COLES|nr:hypothetical protein [Colocasia esculenta]
MLKLLPSEQRKHECKDCTSTTRVDFNKVQTAQPPTTSTIKGEGTGYEETDRTEEQGPVEATVEITTRLRLVGGKKWNKTTRLTVDDDLG